MSEYYTGVGSQSTPDHICQVMEMIGREMYNAGFVLRSGAARGADSAFERGHDSVAGDRPMKEIWLPEPGFQGSKSNLFPAPDAYKIAKRIHPNWKACNEFARNAHARNAHQVLGADLNTPSKGLICWTEGGIMKGGTRTAVVLALEFNIPVFNLGAAVATFEDLVKFLESL